LISFPDHLSFVEAASGLQASMAWADEGSEVFVISQIGYTRGLIAGMRERLGPLAPREHPHRIVDARMHRILHVVVAAARLQSYPARDRSHASLCALSR